MTYMYMTFWNTLCLDMYICNAVIIKIIFTLSLTSVIQQDIHYDTVNTVQIFYATYMYYIHIIQSINIAVCMINSD